MPASKHVFKYSLVSMNQSIKTVKDLFRAFIPFLRPCAVHICFPYGRFDRIFFFFSSCLKWFKVRFICFKEQLHRLVNLSRLAIPSVLLIFFLVSQFFSVIKQQILKTIHYFSISGCREKFKVRRHFDAYVRRLSSWHHSMSPGVRQGRSYLQCRVIPQSNQGIRGCELELLRTVPKPARQFVNCFTLE